jgi:hypothetical protein
MLTDTYRRPIRIAAYVMLVLSAATAFFLGDELWAKARLGELPAWAPLIPPSLFTLFVMVYAADRWLLVRRRLYSGSRALYQLAFGIVFLSLLWPDNIAELRHLRESPTGDRIQRLLSNSDAEVRAAACELLGLRAETTAYPWIEPLAHGDHDASVRAACSEALTRLSAVQAATRP